jgi:predicted  nucleic acid-binding Zn-ribbon protein
VVVQTSVKETLKKLIILQKIDIDLYDYKRQINEKPIEIDGLRQTYERKKSKHDQLEARVRELELTRKAKELDLKVKEQAMVKANEQLMTLKTNKEYQTKLFEIENMKADKSILEDEILRMMDLSEKAGQELAQEKVVLAEEEKKYQAGKEKVDAAINELKEKASVYEAQRREALLGIDKNLLSLYERVVENRDGNALVPVVGQACGGCFMNLPPQVTNKLKMHDELVRCEMCARFLYLPDDV